MSLSSRPRFDSPALRSKTLVLSLLIGGMLLAAVASPARAEFCLPPLFGERPRLHEIGPIRVVWLEVLLREHEVCWRRSSVPREQRVGGDDTSDFGQEFPAEGLTLGSDRIR